MKDYLRLAAWSDAYNWQIYSQLLRRLAIPNIVLDDVSVDIEQLESVERRGNVALLANRLIGSLRASVLSVMPRLYPVVKPRILLGEMGLSKVQMLRLLWRLRSYRAATTALISRRPVRRMSRDESARQALATITGRDEFTSVLISTLAEHFPLVHLEGFAELRGRVQEACQRPPAVVASSTDWYKDEHFKILAAESRKTGSWLVGLQHGGGYGVNRVLPQEDIETAIVDRWLSYGWRCSHRPSIHPFVHPRFRSQRRTIGARSPHNILFVTTNYYRYPHRFESYELPFGRYDLRLEWRRRFILALGPALQRHVQCLLPPRDLGEREHLRTLGVPLRVTTRKSGALLAGARIVVIEYNGTAVLEFLSANVPTLLCWDTRYDGLRADAAPYFERLRAAGILCDSPEEVAARVSAIYSDPWSFWDRAAVQEARRAFVDRYARSDPHWASMWASELGDGVRFGEMRRAAVARAAVAGDSCPRESVTPIA